MTLETQVQALTTATESLLQAVNTRKADLNAAQLASASSAADAANSASLATTNGATQVALAAQQVTAATTQATLATTKANLLGSVAAVTATGTVNIALTDAVYQLINPNGAARDVVLASLTAAEIGYTHSIKNTGTAGNYLTVKNAAGTQLGPLVANGYSLAVVWSGTAWEVL